MEAETKISENIPELPPEPPRESLIATAVKFLQNSKVSQSPMDQKKQFLVKKGLTDEEIQIAITRSGVTTTTVAPLLPNQAVQPQVPPTSTWVRIREYSAVAIIIGGVIYGLYNLYKRFIEPLFLNKQKFVDEKLSQMEDEIKAVNSELGQNMREIRTVMSDVQTQLEEQSVKISQLAANLTTIKADSGHDGVSNSAIGELKAEITSVKGLLLSRNQFPSTNIPRPVIPTWQMKSSASEVTRSPEMTQAVRVSTEHRKTNGSGDGDGDLDTPDEEDTQNYNGEVSSDSDQKKIQEFSDGQTLQTD